VNLFLSDLIVYTVLFVFVLYVTKINNMWGLGKGASKSKVETRKDKNIKAKRSQLLWLLEKCSWFAQNVGGAPSVEDVESYKHKLERLKWVLPYLDRAIKPIELVGVFRIIGLGGVLLGLAGSLLTGSIIFYILFLGVFVKLVFNIYTDSLISDEDMEIEVDFPDLYLLLYSRLTRGAYVRLSPTLEDFISSLDVMYSGRSHKALRKFVVDLRNNIEIYGDDSLAIHKLRDTYKSAMVINFCNLAIQALSGVDNKDKLLAFKMELSQKRAETMKQRAEMLVSKGKKAILAIYIILAQFIVLSWVSRMGGLGGLGNIF